MDASLCFFYSFYHFKQQKNYQQQEKERTTALNPRYMHTNKKYGPQIEYQIVLKLLITWKHDLHLCTQQDSSIQFSNLKVIHLTIFLWFQKVLENQWERICFTFLFISIIRIQNIKGWYAKLMKANYVNDKLCLNFFGYQLKNHYSS